LITTTIATTEQYKNGAAVRDRDTMTKTVNAAEWFGEAEGSTQQMQYVVSFGSSFSGHESCWSV
jgi:hypothetical protein